ncbi:MAG: hypothetical protein HYW01_06420 [Deltaproteobacteria bacterium]|nr:hypothetical protein [Deltaproteobacteria bacterium]
MIDKALEVAKIEWENIRSSLFMCGDIGDFNPMIFSKIYFPVWCNFDWEFDSPLVRTKLKTVFNILMSWQNDPQSYMRDMKAYFEDFEL